MRIIHKDLNANIIAVLFRIVKWMLSKCLPMDVSTEHPISIVYTLGHEKKGCTYYFEASTEDYILCHFICILQQTYGDTI